MSVTVEKLEKNMAKLTIEVSADELEKAIQAAYLKQKNRINIPGFRKGKAPRAMIEKMYGAGIFYEDAANALIPNAYSEALAECEETIVSQPSIDVVQLEKGKPFIFTAEVALKPEVTLGEYKGLEVPKSELEVTEEEVAAIVANPLCKLSHQELKDWYEGYKLNGIDIYNPNSVVSAVSDGKCKSYWSGTSSNEEVVRLINMNFNGIKDDIIKLIEGDEVTFSCTNFQNDMVSIKDKDDAFSLLVCLGYLGCSDTKNQYRKVAYVPNAEIRAVLMDIVREQSWYNRMETIQRSENLLKAINELDGATVATLIQDIHNSSSVSLLDYNDEESLTYCVMTGLLWSTLDDYSCHREDQAGKGRVDLVYEPLTVDYPLILIEFKYDDSAEEAIKQIKEKEYFKRYAGQYRNIILVGINYSAKTKDHQCLIEKMDKCIGVI